MVTDFDIPMTRVMGSSLKRNIAVSLSLLLLSCVRREIAIRNACEILLFQNYWIGRGYRKYIMHHEEVSISVLLLGIKSRYCKVSRYKEANMSKYRDNRSKDSARIIGSTVSQAVLNGCLIKSDLKMGHMWRNMSHIANSTCWK
jgi:hypothetical protein